jgi:hypothetical protein
MAYIGKQPVVGNFQVCDAITVVNGQAAYTMQVGSANVEPENANHMLVSLNGILQKPGSSFTISGATITFASNLATGDVIDFIILLGDTLNIGTPSDNGVVTASIAANAVTGAKLNTDVISAQTALGATPADTDEFLVSDAGVLKRVDYSYIKGGGITTAGQWRVNTDFTMTGQQDNVITSNWEENDTTYARLGSAMSESSGVFTFPETGIYLVRYVCNARYAGDDAHIWAKIQLTTDNSSYSVIAQSLDSIEQVGGSTTYANVVVEAMIDISNVSTHKVKFSVQPQSSSTTFSADSAINLNTVTFIRLGDT